MMESCNYEALVDFQCYLVKKSSYQREVWSRIGGKDTSSGLLTSHSQVSSTVVMNGFCKRIKQINRDSCVTPRNRSNTSVTVPPDLYELFSMWFL